MSANQDINMNASNEITEGFIRYGRRTTDLIRFNEQTTMADVNDIIFQWFNRFLPGAYHIEFYSEIKNKFLHLDTNVLGTELNPFLSRSNNNNEEIVSVANWVELFIVEDSTPSVQNNSQVNSMSANHSDPALINTELFNEFHDGLIPLTIVLTTSDEDLPDNNISINDTDEEGDNNDTIHTNPVTENSLQPLIASRNSTTSSNEYQLTMESTDGNHPVSEPLIFSHDVHPGQKHQHLSNKFNISDGSDENGGVSLMQGFKTKEQLKKKQQVLPHILIPLMYRGLTIFKLLVFAVFEEQENGIRIWYKNLRKGFVLFDRLKIDAELFNPIQLDLSNDPQWRAAGDFILKLYLLTNLNKTRMIKEEIYRLDETRAQRLHKAEHIAAKKKRQLKPTRLLAVRVINNQPCWDTVALSNFMDPSLKEYQSTGSNNATTVPIVLPTVNTTVLPVSFQLTIGNRPPSSLNVINAVQITPPPAKRSKQ